MFNKFSEMLSKNIFNLKIIDMLSNVIFVNNNVSI